MRPPRTPLLHPPISRLAKYGKTLFFRRRQTIFSAGDESEYVFLIQNGSVKLSLTSPEGKEAIIGMLRRGDFFGENALGAPHSARLTSAIAHTDLSVTRIGRDVMLNVLDAEHDTSLAFMLNMIRLRAELTENMADQLLYSGEQRLARILLSIAQLGIDEEAKLLPRVSQQDLANMIGITRQRVNVLMKHLGQLGFIDYARGLRVHSSLREALRREQIAR